MSDKPHDTAAGQDEDMAVSLDWLISHHRIMGGMNVRDFVPDWDKKNNTCPKCGMVLTKREDGGPKRLTCQSGA